MFRHPYLVSKLTLSNFGVASKPNYLEWRDLHAMFYLFKVLLSLWKGTLPWVLTKLFQQDVS